MGLDGPETGRFVWFAQKCQQVIKESFMGEQSTLYSKEHYYFCVHIPQSISLLA